MVDVDIEYANAYAEVLEILKYIKKEDYEKIPEKKLELFKTFSNKDFKFSYNPHKTLIEQSVSKRARAIIAILFRDYWSTDSQKEKILLKHKYDKEQNEEEKKIKYDIDNVLKKRNENVVEEIKNVNLPSKIKEKGKLWKIIDYIKGLFFKKN